MAKAGSRTTVGGEPRPWPAPLARLFQQAESAAAPFNRHMMAYYVWEAGLRLLACTAVAEYVALPNPDAAVLERLKALARPAIGHWWEFIRLLTPLLAERGDQGFAQVKTALLSDTERHDLPALAGLDARITAILKGKTNESSPRSTVLLRELFDHLVTYRNQEIAHAAPAARSDEFHAEMATLFSQAMRTLWRAVDPLASRRLTYVQSVSRASTGAWRIELQELHGAEPRRLPLAEFVDAATDELPIAEQVYLSTGQTTNDPRRLVRSSRLLYPLLKYDARLSDVLFLNHATAGQCVSWLGYCSGQRSSEHLVEDLCQFLAGVLQRKVSAEELAAASESRAEATVETATPADRHRRRVGDFVLERKLGAGSYGEVWEATQISLRRKVALKMLHGTADEESARRFVDREIRALGMVHHPNLVEVYFAGHDGGCHFYAMELVPGADLDVVTRHLKAQGAGPLDSHAWDAAVSTVRTAATQSIDASDSTHPTQPALRPAGAATAALAAVPITATVSTSEHVEFVVQLLVQVADAAQQLHEHHVIHRDIKPGNIVLTPERRAVLMDLGTAQFDHEATMTERGSRQFQGTARYCSPEQLRNLEKVTAASDVYSLGATLWELLTLQPFLGIARDTSLAELFQRVEQTEAPRPSEFNARVSADLNAVVLKCVEKLPERRYANAGELAADLRRWQQGEPVHAQPQTFGYYLRKFVRRHRVALAGAASLVFAALGATGYGFYQIAAARDQALQMAQRNQELAEEEIKSRQAAEIARIREASERAEAERQSRRAEEQSQRAESQSAQVRQQERAARRYLYAAQMNLAQQAWRQGDAIRVLEILNALKPETDQEDLRGWEWHHLYLACHRDQKTITGHQDTVWGVAFSPDGHFVATTSHDRTVRLWEVKSGREVWKRQLARRGWGLAFSGNGNTLAVSQSEMDTDPIDLVEVLDASTGELRKSFLNHTGSVAAVALHPDGVRLAVAGPQTSLWNLNEGTKLFDLAGTTSTVAFSADGKLLATGDYSGKIALWDVAKGTLRRTLAPVGDRVRRVAFSPDGDWLASVGDDRIVHLWSIPLNRPNKTLKGHNDWVWGLAFSPDGRYLATSSDDQSIKVWDLSSGEESVTLRGHTAGIANVCFSPGGTFLASASDDRTVRVWDVTRAQEVVKIPEDTQGMFRTDTTLNKVVASRDGHTLASINWQGRLQLWCSLTGQEQTPLELDSQAGTPTPGQHGNQSDAAVTCAAFRSDGRLVIGTADRAVTTWDLAKREKTLQLTSNNPPTCVAASDDLRWLAVGTADATVELWSLADSVPTHSLTGDLTSQVTSVAFDPENRYLAIATGDASTQQAGEVVLWNLQDFSHRCIPPRPDPSGRSTMITSLAFSPDGKTLAGGAQLVGNVIGKEPGEILIWDVATAREVTRLRGHGRLVKSLAFSPCGGRLASGSWDERVKIWDTAQWQETLTLDCQKGLVHSLAFSGDGKRLITCGNHIRVYMSEKPAEGGVANPAALAAWHFNQATACFQDKQWAAALFHLDRRVMHEPDDFATLQLRGRSYLRTGKWREAAGQFAQAQLLAASDPTVLVWKQLAQRDLAARDQIDADYRRYETDLPGRLVPSNRWWDDRNDDRPPSETTAWREVVLDHLAIRDAGAGWEGERAGGWAAAELAMRIEPSFSQPLWKFAERSLEKTVEKAPEDVVAWLALIRSKMELDKWDAALAACNSALDWHKQEWRVFYLSGLVRHRQGDFTRAITDYTIALKLNATGWGVIAARGRSHIALNHWKDAMADFTTAMSTSADSELFYCRGYARSREHQWTDADEDYSRSIQTHKTAAALFLRGWSRAEAERWDGAIADLEEARRLQPGPVMHGTYACLLLSAGKTAEFEAACHDLLQVIAQADSLEPNHWESALRILTVAPLKEDYSALAKRATDMRTLHPKSTGLILPTGAALYRSGQYTEAIKVLADVAESGVEVDDVFAQFIISLAHQGLNQHGEALETLQVARTAAEKLLYQAASGTAEVSWAEKKAIALLKAEAEAAIAPKTARPAKSSIQKR